MTASRRFLLELHDLSPANPGAHTRMLDCVPVPLSSEATLLVVPDWYGSAPIRRDHVRELSGGSSSQRVLHGLTHSVGRRWRDCFWYGTPNEGEFASLDFSVARLRLAHASELWQEAFGEPPRWFCAPRWQLSAGARRAVRELGLGLLERDLLVTPQGHRVDAPALWFDHGTRRGAQLVGRLHTLIRGRHVLRNNTLVRIALHPRDAETARSREEISGIFGRLVRDGWEPASLESVCTP